MNHVIVIEFTTLDGVVEDPDGSAGTPSGGWAFRHGPEAVAGDKFQLGERMDTGTLLLGRGTWQLFSRLWPGRSDPFSTAMNRIPKLVATRTLTDVTAWSNSAVIDGDLLATVKEVREQRDVVVAGSVSVVQALMAADLVDEYRLLVFPTVVGAGRRLFRDGLRPMNLTLTSAERRGPALLACFERTPIG
jgi:dihydrofolate reductase